MACVLTVIGAAASSVVDEALVAAAAAALETTAGRCGRPDWLAPGIACDLPFDGTTPEAAEAAVRTRLETAPVDIVAQAAAGRRKALLIADMESTMIGQELVDELAEMAGIRDRVAAITARSMAGEIDFAASLEQRVALLAGLPEAALAQLGKRITLNPGARTLVRTLRAHGAYTALVTGGFSRFAEPVRRACGFHEARGNRLIVDRGRVSSRVAAPILGPAAKRAALEELAAARGLSLDDCCALGDGANDLEMIRGAGLGVAYRGKAVLRAVARARIDHGDLTAVLYIQGYRQSEFHD